MSYADTAECVRAIRRIYHHIASRNDPSILSIRPALDCLAIEYAPGFDFASLDFDPEDFDAPEPVTEARILQLPVCYDPALGTDLASVSEGTGLSVDEIVALHTSQTYEVWMLGFMPGFPYIGRLPAPLLLPRKARPSPKVASGSVAIAEEFTGVYPFDSPGGWHVIGRTPSIVTDYLRPNPWLFQYGMKVSFHPVTIEEYNRLAAGSS